MSEKIEKIEIEIARLRGELEKIGNLYNRDGNIDETEQKELDEKLAIITKCEAKLNTMKAKEAEKKMVRYIKFTSPDGKVHMMTQPEFEEFKNCHSAHHRSLML